MLKKKIISLFLLPLCFQISVPLYSENLTNLIPPNELAAQSMKKADQAYFKRTDITQARVALELYEDVLRYEPQNVEALWKASRTCWWVAEHSDSTIEKINTFRIGMELAEKAIAIDPNCVEAHFWNGSNMGSFGEAKGILKSLFLVKPVRKEMNEVIRIDPKFQGGAGYRVLGIVDYKVPGFAGGSRDRAIENLNKAFSIDPNNFFTYYYLAEYFSTINEFGKAKEYLLGLEKLKTDDENMPDLLMMQKKGNDLLKRLGN